MKRCDFLKYLISGKTNRQTVKSGSRSWPSEGSAHLCKSAGGDVVWQPGVRWREARADGSPAPGLPVPPPPAPPSSPPPRHAGRSQPPGGSSGSLRLGRHLLGSRYSHIYLSAGRVTPDFKAVDFQITNNLKELLVQVSRCNFKKSLCALILLKFIYLL